MAVEDHRTIREFSPHLAGALHRVGRPFPQLVQAFEFAMQNGGRLELDFERDPESSFNPRPARIALILLQDAKITDDTSLAASVIASAAQVSDAAPPALSAELLDTAASALQPADLVNENAAALACALHLDRARHLHLAPDAKAKWQDFLQLTESYLPLAERSCPPLHILLTTWHARSCTRNRR